MAVIDLSPFNSILARLEGVADRLERVPGGGSGAGKAAGAAPAAAAAAVDEPAIAQAFDAFLKEKLPALETAAKDSGIKDIEEGTAMFVSACGLLKQLFIATGACKKPADADWGKFLGPVMELGGNAQKACDNRSDFFQNRKAVAESLNIVTLVTAGSPPSHIQNVLETMDFHAIKVMQKKIDKETAWIKALKAIVKDMQEWCKENCKMGLVWKVDGKNAVDYFAEQPLGAAAAQAPPSKGKGKGPPQPKGGLSGPPPEVLEKMKEQPKAAPGVGGMAAIMSGIEGFSTGNLKKVTNDMKAKNMKDVPVLEAKPRAAAAAPAPAAGGGRFKKGPKGPPLKELQKDTNWVVENYENDSGLTVDEADMTCVVLFINCKNCTLKINNKVKSVSIDGCEKVNVVCNDVLSTVELVNSDKCNIQTLGKINSVAIDKCNGVGVFLSKESLQAELVTSKSSEMNVTIPAETEDGDPIEMPIPEQFVTTVVGPKVLKTEVSGIYHS